MNEAPRAIGPRRLLSMWGDMPEVVGVGQCALDLLGNIGRWPEPDSKAELSELLEQGGGPVATALVTLARLGVDTAIQSSIGADDAGEKIRAGLEREGVDCCN